HRRAAARSIGADAVLSPEEADLRAWQELTGSGCDLAFEFAGNDPAIAAAFRAARPGARLLLGGIPTKDSSTLQAGLARRKGLTILMVRRMKEMYPRAIELASSGRGAARSLVSRVLPISQADAAFVSAGTRDGLKVIIDPGA